MTPEELQERLDAQKWWDHYLNVLNERDRLREALEEIAESHESHGEHLRFLARRALATHKRPEGDA